MEKEFERKYHSLEKEHWWFISRRDIIRRIVNKFEKNIKILEIGCSSGRLMNALNEAKFKEIIGIDISKEATHFCRKNNIKSIIRMDGSKMGFKEKEFDLIIASDILEHIYDDSYAVREWKRVLKENGKILAFVPAFNLLWSDHDIVNRHLRRYNRQELKALFERNGLRIVRTSYWNLFLFFPILIKRLILNKIRRRSKPKDDLFRMNKAINVFFCLLLTIENIYCRFFNLPLGLSLFIIAKK
jgi:Methylase involved in ubiquinone/menaquinone biosynthesis